MSIINITSDDGICTKVNSVLYRYYTIDDNFKRSLTEGYLWFSNPAGFNDPYDCNMQTVSVCTFDELYAYFTEAYPKMPLGFIENRTRELINNPNERLRLSKEADKETIDNLGICCFSQSKSSLLMWSHYADKHQGICLGFGIMEDSNLFKKKLIAVEYPQKYPIHNWPNDRGKFNSIRFLIGTKSKDWKYENEFRLFRDNTDGAFREKIPFRKQSLKTVYFGYKCKAEIINEVLDILKKDENYSSVKCYKAELKEYDFGVYFREL